MKSTFFTLSWRDFGKALIVAFITTFVVTIGQSLGIDNENGSLHWPTLVEWITALKIAGRAALAYLIKNLFTNDVAQAKRILEDAEKK